MMEGDCFSLGVGQLSDHWWGPWTRLWCALCCHVAAVALRRSSVDVHLGWGTNRAMAGVRSGSGGSWQMVFSVSVGMVKFQEANMIFGS